MAGDFDSFEVEIICPQCGHRHGKTIGWLRGHGNLICEGCDNAVELDQEQVRGGLERLEKELKEFREMIQKIGKI